MLIKEIEEEINFVEMLFARHKKEYDDEGNEINTEPIASKISRFEALKKWRQENTPEVNKRKCMRRKIKERVNLYVEPWFCTITFKNEALSLKDHKRMIRYYLELSNIKNYCFVSDYGGENGRLHYHGYIDMYGTKKEAWGKASTKKYGGAIMNKYLEKMGFNLFTQIRKDKLNCTLNYCTKYILKDMEANYKHEMFASRGDKRVIDCAKLTKEELDKLLPF